MDKISNNSNELLSSLFYGLPLPNIKKFIKEKNNKDEMIKYIEKKLNKTVDTYKQCLENIKKQLKTKLTSNTYTVNEIDTEINLLETNNINCSDYKKIQKILNDTLHCSDISNLPINILILVLMCYKKSIDEIENIKEKSIKYIKDKYKEEKIEEISLFTDIKLFTDNTNFNTKKIKDYKYQDEIIKNFIEKIKDFNSSTDIKENKEEYIDFIGKIIEYNLKYLDYLTTEYDNVNKEKGKITKIIKNTKTSEQKLREYNIKMKTLQSKIDRYHNFNDTLDRLRSNLLNNNNYIKPKRKLWRWF